MLRLFFNEQALHAPVAHVWLGDATYCLLLLLLRYLFISSLRFHKIGECVCARDSYTFIARQCSDSRFESSCVSACSAQMGYSKNERWYVCMCGDRVKANEVKLKNCAEKWKWTRRNTRDKRNCMYRLREQCDVFRRFHRNETKTTKIERILAFFESCVYYILT